MKPLFSLLNSKTSTVVAIPIVGATIMFYITRAIYLPASDIFPMALTAFGITAALSGICFTMAPIKKEDTGIRFAGEKFLHSSLLLIQSIIVIYVKESMLSLTLINTYNTIKIIIDIVLSILIVLVSVVAAISWLYGFDELNTDLWKKWEKRIELMRESKKKEKTKNKDEKDLK
jgi:hypothetical protein